MQRLTIGFILLLAPVLVHAQEPDRYTVVFVDRTVNIGEAPVTDVELRIACAQDTPSQTVYSRVLMPDPAVFETDKWGQEIARWRAAELRPRGQLVARTITEATLHPEQMPLENVDPGAAIPAEVRNLYLADGRMYALESEAVCAAADEIQARGGGPVERVGHIFDYVTEHLSYALEGGWQGADVVLERGTGSCSEYTFTFVALCRACGIPARYSGGNGRRSGSAVHIDRVSHRWSEAYLPGLGWVPFDPTSSDGKNRHRRYFGKRATNVLALARGDGGEEAALNWRYESYHVWEGEGAEVAVHRRGWWFTNVPAEVRCQTLALGGALSAAGTAAEKRGLLAKAGSIGHPMVLAWVDDMLYDPDLRVEAAQVMRDIGGPATAVALVDCLGRVGDAEGDEEIAYILSAWSGQRLGCDRDKWYAWVKSAGFREFSKPGKEASQLDG